MLYRSLQQGAGSLNIKRLLLIKENQISQVKEFSVFPYMGRCKILASLKLSLSYASQLSGASIPHFSYRPSQLLGAYHSEWLLAVG